jgi:hypothetical protein
LLEQEWHDSYGALVAQAGHDICPLDQGVFIHGAAAFTKSDRNQASVSVR